MKNINFQINNNSLQKTLLKILINLKFAISLFFLISFYGICGSILEQEQSSQYYIENYDYNFPLLNVKFYNFIFKFGLDHIFTTYWFYLLIIVFGCSLISCSFLRQLPLFLFSRGNKFYYKNNIPKNFQIYKNFNSLKSFSITPFLSNEKYFIFHKQGSFYSYKGLLGKFAPLIVHFSLIIILIGTCIASLTSFSAQELIPKTETFIIQNTIRKSLFSIFPTYSLRVNDFWINYDEEENIQQYFSDISILNNNGKEQFEKIISVNKPLNYKNLVVYQTDWDLIAIRLKFKDGTYKQIPLNKIDNNNKSWISSLEINGNNFFLVINNLNGYVSLYDKNGSFLKQLELFDDYNEFKIVDIIPRTGLQIKIDQGIPVLYLGFLFLMISIILSNQYFPELWFTINNKNKNFIIAGKTNRQELSFDLETYKIFTKVSSSCKS